MLAMDFEIERVPPEAIILFGPASPMVGLFEGQIFKQAFGMKRRQGLLHAVLVLGRQMAVDDSFKRFVHECMTPIRPTIEQALSERVFDDPQV